MPSCVVRGCVCTWKKRDPSIILHCFPKEPEKIRLWLQQTGQYGIDIDQMVEKVYLGKVYDSYRMCSLHFTHDCYNYDGYRRVLKKDAVPTIFIKKTPSTTAASTTIPSVSTASCYDYQVEAPDTYSKPFSQSLIQRLALVPVVPQRISFKAGTASQKSNSVVVGRSTTIQTTVTATSEAMKKHSALSGVSQQSSVLRPSKEVSKVAVSSSSSSRVQQSTSIDEKLNQRAPANVQKSTSAKSISSVLVNSSLPLDTQLRPEVSSLSTQTSSSIITSLSAVPNPVISTSGIQKFPYKTTTTTPSSIALSIVRETKPYSRIFLPVSGNVSSATQTPPTTLNSAHKLPSVVHIPFKAPVSQAVTPDCLPPSKKRKLEENIVFVEPREISSSAPNVSPSHGNTGKVYLVSNSAPLVQPPSLTQKPLMVDKGVNTDFLTNRKSCCISTDHWYMRRNAYTQTKISTKHRKIMCTLLAPNEPLHYLESNVSALSPEDTEMNNYSPSSSCYGNIDPYEDLEAVDLDLVKVEISSDTEIDAPVPAASDIKQASNIKEDNHSSPGKATPFKSNSTLPDFDISKVKIEPDVKTEEDEYPISTTSQDITTFVLQTPKIERASPIACDPFAPVYRSPISRETSAIQSDDETEDQNDSMLPMNELSENEDESFLVPSDVEDKDDVKRVFQDLDSPVENVVDEEKYIVFESCLKKLIMMIPCKSETKCTSPLTQYRKETVGSYLSIEVRCSSGHTSLLWESQPRHGYEPLGNVLLSAAVLFSGSSFVKCQNMFNLLNVKSIDKATYSKTQSMYLFPTINHHWKEEQKAVIQSIQEKPLCLAGDKQLDNPAYSAKYSTYSLIDVASKKICSFSVDPVTPLETLENLEQIGFQNAMGELQSMNADVKRIVTDRSVAIQEILNDKYPGILHQLDLWHLSRSIGNEVLMAAKHKDCEILYQWVEPIRNHLWWSYFTCNKNPNLLIQNWKSVIHHVANVHKWNDENSDRKACHHPPLPEKVVNNTHWLEKDSSAYERLKNIVENTSLLEDLKQLSFHCHTGELDIYRRTCRKYHPKTLHFFMDSMVARTQLAALDHNRNIHTVKEVVKNALSDDALGSMTQNSEVSRSPKSWITKALNKPTCQNFLFNIMNDVISFVKEEKNFQ